MIIVDVNLLLYAENSRATEHAAAKNWWESELAAQTELAFDWTTILAFVRLTTNGKIFPNPLSPQDATDRVDKWLSRSHVHLMAPGPDHWAIYMGLVRTHSLTGNSLTDAHLAASAIENGWELYSADNGYSRYSDLRWVNPIASGAI